MTSPSGPEANLSISPRLQRRDWAALALSAGLALGFCLYHLGSRSIWHDEAVALRIARSTSWGVVMSDGGNMALYYRLLGGWINLGTSLEMLRLPSVVFSVAGVVLLYLLARRLFDFRVAVMSALLLAVNSSLVYYGQEARSYALVLMLVVGGWLALAVALERRTVGWFLLWGTLAALAVGAHLFSVLLVGAQIASLALLRWRNLPKKGLLAGLAVAAAGAAPFLVAAASRGTVQIDWIPPISAASFRQILWFLGGNNFEPDPSWWPRLAGVVVLAVYLAGWTAGTWLAVRALRTSGRSPQAWRYGMAVLWLVVPLVGATAASITVQPLLVPRFFLAAVPAGSLLMAVALARVPGRKLSTLVPALVLALGVSGVVRSYSTGHWGWDRASEHLVQAARPGDPVVILPLYERLSVDYHLRQSSAYRSLNVLSPREGPWRPPDHTVFGVSEAFFLPTSPEQAAAEAGRHNRFWLVTSDYTRWDASGRVQEAWGQASGFFDSLDSGFRVRSGEAIGRVGVLLLERPPEASQTADAGS